MLRKRSRTLSANRFKDLGYRLKQVSPFFLFLLVLYLLSRFLTVHRVICVLNNQPCPPEITARTDRYLGSNILFINQKKMLASVKTVFPVDKINLGFKLFNTLHLQMTGRLSPLNLQVALVQSLPTLDTFSVNTAFVNFEIWDNGLMTPTASAESKIKYFFVEKPDPEIIKSLYRLIKLAEKYLDSEQIIVLDRTLFLRHSNQPDIIVDVPFDEDSLVSALQSYAYLTTIKKDTKVIDLRFKNPILR